MTKEQYEAAMRAFRLELKYMEFIKEKANLKNGDGIFRLMNSGDFYEGFKAHCVQQQHGESSQKDN